MNSFGTYRVITYGYFDQRNYMTVVNLSFMKTGTADIMLPDRVIPKGNS